MNIDDVKTEDVVIPNTNDILPAIFARQHELAVKYGPIERKNGFYYPDLDNPPHIDDAVFQRWIKDMLWRATEEIAEAFEVVPSLIEWRDRWSSDSALRHFFEELSDSLHFITEVSIVVGITPADIAHVKDVGYVVDYQLVLERAFNLIVAMGLAGNTLKNKPWKETQMPTDAAKFKERMCQVWVRFSRLAVSCGLDLADVYLLYMKKHAVNKFRQATRY